MITRKCDFCGKEIEEERFIDLWAQQYKTKGAEIQDAINSASGDYCPQCLKNGNAVNDLLESIRQQEDK